MTDTDTTPLLAADSFSVRNGRVRGLSLHVQRFISACHAQGHPVDPAEIYRLLRDAEGSPRLELTTAGILLQNRPARPESETATLAVDEAADPRRQPKIKGPDIPVVARLLAEVSADERLLVDPDGLVVECCYSTPVIFTAGSIMDDIPWRAEFPQHPGQLDSVTARLVRRALLWLGVTVIETDPLTPEQLLASRTWLLNATHIRRVVGTGQDARATEWPEALIHLQAEVIDWLDHHAELLPR